MSNSKNRNISPRNTQTAAMKHLITLAKRFAKKPTSFNEVQFLDEFNKLSDIDQLKAVQKGTEISKVLVGWAAAARFEIEAELNG